MEEVFFCDFEFMSCIVETGVILTSRTKNKNTKGSLKGKTRCIPLVMISAKMGNDAIYVDDFSRGDIEYEHDVCDAIFQELKKCRIKRFGNALGKTVVVWDKNGDAKFLEGYDVIDLREILRDLEILRQQKFLSQTKTEMSQECSLKEVSKRLVGSHILNDINTACQIENWTSPSKDMLAYAENDVVMLRELTNVALRQTNTKTFGELRMLSERKRDIHTNNVQMFGELKRKSTDTYFFAKFHPNIGGQYKMELLTKIQKRINIDFSAFDQEMLLYISCAVEYSYDMTQKNDDYEGTFTLLQPDLSSESSPQPEPEQPKTHPCVYYMFRKFFWKKIKEMQWCIKRVDFEEEIEMDLMDVMHLFHGEEKLNFIELTWTINHLHKEKNGKCRCLICDFLHIHTILFCGDF